MTVSSLVAALRAGAEGLYALEAATGLVIAHGTSDDNVHIQNTIQMTQALIRSAKQFDLMAYPGKTHGISGLDAIAHLYHLIEDHFTRQLKATPADGGQMQ